MNIYEVACYLLSEILNSNVNTNFRTSRTSRSAPRRAGYMLLAALTLLAGCATKDVGIVADQTILGDIQRTGDAIHRDLSVLSALQQTRAPRVRQYQPPANGPLARPITMKWAGPMLPAVEAIAKMVGYQFRSTGKPPAHPVIVSVSAAQTSAFLVLEDIGWQAGQRAGIHIDDAAREIRVVFVGDDT